MKFDFNKHKYGKELLIDCAKFSKTKGFLRNDTPFLISYYEIFFITEGKGIFKLNDTRINFKRGTILFLSPNKWRQWSVIDKLFDGYFLGFEEEFITNFFHEALFLFQFHYFHNNSTPSFIQTDKECFENILIKLYEIQSEIKNLQNDSTHLLRSQLYYLLIHLNRIYANHFNLKDELLQDNLILRFRRLLEQDIVLKQTVSEYAESLKVSKSHLNKRLKEHFGQNCSKIIKDRLIIEIKRELLFSTKTIAEISYDLHFSEPGNFNRFFKKMVKMTPREYRVLNSK